MTGVGDLCRCDGDYADGATQPGLPSLIPRPPQRGIQALAASPQTVKKKASLEGLAFEHGPT